MNLRPGSMQATLQAFLIGSIVTFAGASLAAPVVGQPPMVRDDGLVSVQPALLDKAFMRPNVNFTTYRKVMIDPVTVEFSKDWLRNMNDGRYVYRLRDEDVQTIRDDITASTAGIVADTFSRAGYEIVSSPGADVLRLSPRVTELYVNAPDILPPGRTRSFISRDAGQATLVLEARDAGSGTLLAVMVEHGTADNMQRYVRTNGVNNMFWFDGLYKR